MSCLNTNRLSFFVVNVDDAIDLFPIWVNYAVTKYTFIRNIQSVDDCIKRINRQLAWIKNNSIGPFVVKEKNKIIGYCGGNNSGNDATEYGIFYHLREDKWGKGYGTEIAKALIRCGFQEKNAKTIIAEAVIENIGSWKVLEKAGMKRICIESSAFENETGKHDLYKYKILLAACRIESKEKRNSPGFRGWKVMLFLENEDLISLNRCFPMRRHSLKRFSRLAESPQVNFLPIRSSSRKFCDSAPACAGA